MKKFESAWRDGFDFYERYYDENLQRSVKRKIDLKYEWFEESSNGLYTFILDDSVKLEKRQGNAKQGRDHYGFMDPMYRNIRDNYWNKDGWFNSNPKTWYLDIETRTNTVSSGFPSPNKALEPISLFQIFDSELDTVIMLGVRDWKHQGLYALDYPVKYINCRDEITLIQTYLKIFKKADPLIIYAWNGLGFDFPYMFNRLKNLGLDTNELSNYGNVTYSENVFQGKLEYRFNADGHHYIDMLDVYKKFVFAPRPSYALDVISEIELGENKVQHDEYPSFDDFYTCEHYIIRDKPYDDEMREAIRQLQIKKSKVPEGSAEYKQLDEEAKERAHSEFCFYGYKDPLLIKKIDDKQNFTVIMCMIAEKMGVLLNDTLGTVKPWSQYIANKSMLNKQVLPPRKEYDTPSVVGGFVRDPIAGKHNWVLSADVNSMYPLLGMVGFNMSPETFIPKHKLPPELRDIVLAHFNDQNESERFELDKSIWNAASDLLKEHNISLGINGAAFDKTKLGMVPEMVQDIYDSRKQAKKTMFAYQQRKILIKEILKERLIAGGNNE